MTTNTTNWNILYGIHYGNHMIDSITDTVFFSDLLPERCPTMYQSLDKILKENDIDHRLLSHTKDIWCRDYMPIQTSEKRFVFYKYNPDYLQTKYYQRTLCFRSMLLLRNGIRKNKREALKYFRRAAKNEYAAAVCMIGK